MEYALFRTGNKTALALIQSDHTPLLVAWFNDHSVTHNLGRQVPMHLHEEKHFIESQHERMDTDQIFLVLAKVEEGWKPIGTMGLHKINHLHKSAETGAMIGEQEYQSKGYGSEAKILLLEYAFDVLDLEVLISRAFASNARSIAYSERCGYVHCGCIPRYRWRLGKREDEVILAIHRDRFKVVREFYRQNGRVPHRQQLPELFSTP